MKPLKLTLLIAVLLTTITTLSLAEIPHAINYQGKLTDPSGSPVSDGTYSVTFRIYDVQAGGSPIWYETQSITTQKGLFDTQIGATKDLNLAFDKPYYLGIKVGTDAEMTPRQALSSSAYAYRADDADNLNGQDGSYYNNITNLTISGQSRGDIIYYNGSNWARLGAGSSGQILQTNSTTANPKWVDFIPIAASSSSVGAVIASADTEYAQGGYTGSWDKIKEIRVNFSGYIKASIEMHASYGATAFAYLYVNGKYTEKQLSSGSTTYQEYYFPGEINVSKGDLVQLYKLKSGTDGTTYWRSFKLYASVLPAEIVKD